VGFLARFRRTAGSNRGDAPRIEYGSRGEEIIYRLGEKSIEIGFSWASGARLETDGIERWRGGTSLTDDEKRRIFNDVLTFVNTTGGKPVVAINRDAPSETLWSDLCAKRQSDIKRVEYTSDDAARQMQREDWLDTLRAGKQLIVDGETVETEADVDRVLERLKRSKA